MKLPAAFKLAPAQVKAIKVVVKSTAKACIMALGGWLTLKLGGTDQVAALVAVALAPILKVIDPNDHTIGFKKS